MFQSSIGSDILEVSHKRIERPTQGVYFNHIHNHCELLLFISGQADYNIDGQIFSPAPYDLLFIPAATYHYLIPTAEIPYENYVIGIDPIRMDSAQYTVLFTSPLMISIKDDPELIGFFQRLDYYCEHYTDSDFSKSADCLIQELITYCAYRKPKLTHVLSDTIPYIDDIIEYINQNLQSEIDAQSIANHFLLSKSYIQNIFSQNMHIGIKKYIMQKKIYAAHADLSRGLHPTMVCEKYAFSDYSVFYRLYRKTFASSPRSHGSR